MESQLIDKFLVEIKKGRKYKTISDEIVLNEIKSYFKSNPNISKLEKIHIKEIRSKLHYLYSSYLRGKKNKREKLLVELRKNPKNKEIIKKILETSVSAKERLEDYEEIYEKIFKIAGRPSSIVDLGCGLNPFSFYFMNLKELDYYAYDIDEEDVKFLNQYFEIMKQYGLRGKAEILDAKNLEKIKNIPDSDLIFMFKLMDLIREKKKKIIEELIGILMHKTKFLAISFATKTLSGKSMNLPRRTGFELMLKRLNFKFHLIKTRNEIFYVIYN